MTARDSARRGSGCALLLACSALGAACIAMAPGLPRVGVTATVPDVPRLDDLPGVTLAPLVDARPAALRDSWGPHVQSRWAAAFLFGVFLYEGALIEGQTSLGDDQLRIGGLGSSNQPIKALAVYLRKLLAAASGSDVAAPALATAPAALARPAAIVALPDRLGIDEGVVVVPILDQLDVSGLLATRRSRLAVAEGEDDGDGIQIDASAVEFAHGAESTTASFANVRVRLVVLRRAQGRTVARHVIYARGFGEHLAVAVDQLGREVASGLAGLFAPSPPPVEVPEEEDELEDLRLPPEASSR